MDEKAPPVAEVVAKTSERDSGAVLDSKNAVPVTVGAEAAVDRAPLAAVVIS